MNKNILVSRNGGKELFFKEICFDSTHHFYYDTLVSDVRFATCYDDKDIIVVESMLNLNMSIDMIVRRLTRVEQNRIKEFEGV